jgi:hypothetical protein
MKTKTILILCLFLGIGMTQLSAQLPANIHGTGSVAYDTREVGWGSPVYCEGVQVNCLNGTGNAHVIDHYTNGVWDWEIITLTGTGKSCWFPGETFTFKEIDKVFVRKPGEWDVSTHVKGDKGSLYYVSIVVTFDENWNITSWNVKNASCTGNAK